jgi:hypothetical protein
MEGWRHKHKKASLGSMVTKPKSRGGLGVINLRMQNEALLIKNLHKFFNKADLPWVKLIWSQYYSNRKVLGIVTKGGFCWRSIVKLLNKYKGIAQAELGSMDSILFWSNMWNGRVLMLTYPKLYSFTLNTKITV